MERLCAVALSVGLIIPRGKCVSGHVVHASSPPKYLDRDCVQGLGMAMSTIESEENREMLFIGNVFYKQRHLNVLFTSVSRARPPENRKY